MATGRVFDRVEHPSSAESRRDRANELQELFPGPHRELAQRLPDDVRVDVVAQVEADGDPLWAGSHWIVVGNARNARLERESYGDWSGRPSGMRR